MVSNNTVMQLDEKQLNFSQTPVLVLGDVMLDRYWHGHSERLSPEAPVPVVKIKRVEERPGGAANVALNLSALGVPTRLLGLIGADEAGDSLRYLLEQAGVTCCLEQVAYPTVTKTRILSGHQQMIRLDAEERFEVPQNPLWPQFQVLLAQHRVVILSDYGKGTLSPIPDWIQLAKKQGVPVIVDPKARDLSVYRGASIITPNQKEFEQAVGVCSGLPSLIEKAQNLLTALEGELLLVTRGEQGMLVVPKDAPAVQIPALAREVFDVSGAGDTVVAVLAAAWGTGIEGIRAAQLANVAASLVVAKLGTAVVSLQELKVALAQPKQRCTGIVPETDLLREIQTSRSQGERIVFTNGCFDILHAGHVQLLNQAKSLGDRLVVAVNDDASVRRLKGMTRPLNPLQHRMSILAALEAVDWVVSFSEDTPARLIQTLSPHVLVKGGDYQVVDDLVGADHVLNTGGQVKILDFKPGCSTTGLIQRMEKAIPSNPGYPVGVVD